MVDFVPDRFEIPCQLRSGQRLDIGRRYSSIARDLEDEGYLRLSRVYAATRRVQISEVRRTAKLLGGDRLESCSLTAPNWTERQGTDM